MIKFKIVVLLSCSLIFSGCATVKNHDFSKGNAITIPVYNPSYIHNGESLKNCKNANPVKKVNVDGTTYVIVKDNSCSQRLTRKISNGLSTGMLIVGKIALIAVSLAAAAAAESKK